MANKVQANAPRYVIKRVEDRWGLFLDTPGVLLMERLATYKSKGEAIATASLLAGRTRAILIEGK